MTNDGTFVAIGAAGVVRFASTTAILTNNADGVIDLQGDGGGLIINGGGSLVNNGTLEHTLGTASNVTTVSIPVNNKSTGTINAGPGVLTVPTLSNLAGNTLTGGSYVISGVLEFNSLVVSGHQRRHDRPDRPLVGPVERARNGRARNTGHQ